MATLFKENYNQICKNTKKTPGKSFKKCINIKFDQGKDKS